MPSKSTISPAGAGMRPTLDDDMMDGIDDAHDFVQVWPGVSVSFSVTSTRNGTCGGWSELKSRAACRSIQHQAGTYLALSLYGRAFLGGGGGENGRRVSDDIKYTAVSPSGQRLLFCFFCPPGLVCTRASGSTLQQAQLFFSIKQEERNSEKSNSKRHDTTHRRSLTPSVTSVSSWRRPKQYALSYTVLGAYERRKFRQPRYYLVLFCDRRTDGRNMSIPLVRRPSRFAAGSERECISRCQPAPWLH